MSVIGPRPLLVEYLPYYTKEEHHRHDVRPGLSGWAQINGRNAIDSWEQRFQYDLEYVRAVWAFAIVYVLCASILMKGYLKLTKSQKKVMKFVPIIVVILAFAINKITKMRNAEADLFTNAYCIIIYP